MPAVRRKRALHSQGRSSAFETRPPHKRHSLASTPLRCSVTRPAVRCRCMIRNLPRLLSEGQNGHGQI